MLGVYLKGRLPEAASGFRVGWERRTGVRDDFAQYVNNFQTELGLAKMGASGEKQI